MDEKNNKVYDLLSSYYLSRNVLPKDVGSQVAVPAGGSATIIMVGLEPGAQGVLQGVAYGHNLDILLAAPAIYLGYDVQFSVFINNTPLNNDTSPPITKDFNRSLSYSDLRYIATNLPSNSTVTIKCQNNTGTPLTAWGRIILYTDPRGQTNYNHDNHFDKMTPSTEIKKSGLLGGRSW